MDVGFLGLGVMGQPMALNLARAVTLKALATLRAHGRIDRSWPPRAD